MLFLDRSNLQSNDLETFFKLEQHTNYKSARLTTSETIE